MRIQAFFCLLYLVVVQGFASARADHGTSIGRVFPGFSQIYGNHPIGLDLIASTELTAVAVVENITAIHHDWLERQAEPQISHSCLLENIENSSMLIWRSLHRLQRSGDLFLPLTASQLLLAYWGELYTECSDQGQLAGVLENLGCSSGNLTPNMKRDCALLKLASDENRSSCHYREWSHQSTFLDFSGCRNIPDDIESVKALAQIVATMLVMECYLLSCLIGYRWWLIIGYLLPAG